MEDNSVISNSYFEQPTIEISSDNAMDILHSAEIRLSDQLQEPPVCIEISGRNYPAGIGTLGNFSLLKGKAKSRKTFASTLIMAATVRNDGIMYKVRGVLPEGKTNVVYFDTEQSAFHVQRMAERVTRLAELTNPTNFKVFSLRKYNPAERLLLIESGIYNMPGVGMVVIDGIRDLVSSINDEEQATSITSKLLKWTEELNIHILVILHENKGNEFARGHLGSELVNKAETVLTVAKTPEDETVSIVEADFCRDREPEPFAFSIDETGLPYIVDWQPTEKTKTVTPGSTSFEKHKEILKVAFSPNAKPRYKELVSQLKYAAEKAGLKMGVLKAKDFLTYYVNEDHITKHGTDRTPDAHYTLNHVL